MWRWSGFSIQLTEEDKQKILNTDEVVMSDYDFEILSMIDACERFVELQDESDFTDEEIKEIYKTIYLNDEKIYDEDLRRKWLVLRRYNYIYSWRYND